MRPRSRRKVEQCWVWRNVYVAETDAEAERMAVPAFIEMHEHRVAMRNRIYAEQGASILPMPPPGPRRRLMLRWSMRWFTGRHATVAEKLAPLNATGVGGLIMQFRLGPMSYEQTAASLTLFRDKVIPALETRQRADDHGSEDGIQRTGSAICGSACSGRSPRSSR